MSTSTDLNRLRDEYANRTHRLTNSNRYSLFNQAYLFEIQQRQRALLDNLRRDGFSKLDKMRILEVGCGSGGVMLEYFALGASQNSLTGVDLLPARLRETHNLLPLSGVDCADGQNLPFSSTIFDLVLQYTAFSSILDNEVRGNMAREMLRVLKPNGAVIWYDFWINPTNKQTRGISPTEIRQLFPNCTYHIQKVTLAPPIARRLVPISWGLALFIENLKIFNSHFLAVICPFQNLRE